MPTTCYQNTVLRRILQLYPSSIGQNGVILVMSASPWAGWGGDMTCVRIPAKMILKEPPGANAPQVDSMQAGDAEFESWNGP